MSRRVSAASARAFVVVLGALAGFLGLVWGRNAITIAVGGGDLVVDGGDARTIAGATGAIVDLAYGSLRVPYANGRSVQTAKLGGCGPAKLRAIAAATTALLVAPR